jgi:hypothetical protein
MPQTIIARTEHEEIDEQTLDLLRQDFEALLQTLRGVDEALAPLCKLRFRDEAQRMTIAQILKRIKGAKYGDERVSASWNKAALVDAYAEIQYLFHQPERDRLEEQRKLINQRIFLACGLVY